MRWLRWALCALVAQAAMGCAEPLQINNDILKAPRYIRYTLRAQPSGLDQQAFRSNYLSFPVAFKVGSKVGFKFYSEQRIDLNFNGLTVNLFPRDRPYPTDEQGIRAFIEKHFAATEEELNLGSLDSSTLKQVESGIVAGSMPKEHVFLALGYPSHVGSNHVAADDLTRAQIFEQSIWHYRYNEIMWISSWYSYQFDDDGKLAKRVP